VQQTQKSIMHPSCRLPAVSTASFANRSDLNRSVFSATARRYASYFAQAFAPSRAPRSLRLKLASARALASLTRDTIVTTLADVSDVGR